MACTSPRTRSIRDKSAQKRLPVPFSSLSSHFVLAVGLSREVTAAPSLVGTSSPEERTRLPRLLDYCSSVACQPPSTRWIDAIASRFHVPSSKIESRLFLPSAEVSESGSNKVGEADRTKLAAPPPETTLLFSTPILSRVGLLRIVLFAVLFATDFRFFPFDRGITHPNYVLSTTKI
jgi:hypothetical protein